MKNIKRDIELLFEIGTFRYVDRTWKQFLNSSVANCSEHTFRMTWIALTLARYEKNVDYEKLMMTALLHDLPESRCGDVHYLSRQYVERREDEAVKDMFDGSSHGSKMSELFREYEERKTIESKIVKDADNLDIELELRELDAKGNSISKLWTKNRQDLVYPKLYTETAKRFWKEISKADPHDWHAKSPQNRFNLGDWKKKK